MAINKKDKFLLGKIDIENELGSRNSLMQVGDDVEYDEQAHAVAVAAKILEENPTIGEPAISVIRSGIVKFNEKYNAGDFKTAESVEEHFNTVLVAVKTVNSNANIDFSCQFDDKDAVQAVVLSVGDKTYPIPISLCEADVEWYKQKNETVTDFGKKMAEAAKDGLDAKELESFKEQLNAIGVTIGKEKDGDINLMAGYATAHIDVPDAPKERKK